MINLTMKNPEAINENDLANVCGGKTGEYTLNFIAGVLYGITFPISTIIKSRNKFKDSPGISAGITISSIILMAASGYEICKSVSWATREAEFIANVSSDKICDGISWSYATSKKLLAKIK